MKNNGILKAFVLALGLTVIGVAAYALDYPHSGINAIGCGSCHTPHGGGAGLLLLLLPDPPLDIDDTQINHLCWNCHNDVTAPYERTHSSLAIDNSYGDWTVECTNCHEPHKQKQFRTYGSGSYRATGIVDVVTATTLTKTGAGWTPDQFQGFVLIPNITEPNYNYGIFSNTTSTLNIDDGSLPTPSMNLSKVTAGVDTFAVVYGQLVRERIAYPNVTSVANPVKFFDLCD